PGPSRDGPELRDGLLPSDIGRLVFGPKFLGGSDSQYKGFVEGVTMKRVVKTVEFDKELQGAVEDIVVGGSPFFGDLQWSMTSLPIMF
ncbi:hypothetical protein L195_g054099, partial [Trifolium pratense]